METTSECIDIINRSSWFEYICGVKEIEFRQTKEKYISRNENGEIIITNPITLNEFSCGKLEMIPLQKLRQIPKETIQPALFEIIVRLDEESQPQVEVTSMQTNPKYNKSVFVVASNFNAVESVSENISPDSSKFTTNYIYDQTQGPAASIGAPAAAIERVHFPFYDENTLPSSWHQTKKHQIEILKDLKKYYNIENGYPLLNSTCENPSIFDYDKYISCIHSNVETTFRFNSTQIEVIKKEHRNCIDQVFGAALNIGQGSSGMTNKRIAKQRPILSKLPLDCAYETAYLTAIRNKREKIILTLLGNGVFGNDTKEVCESIIRNHLEYGMKNNSTLSKVILPIYSIGGNDVLDIMKKLLKQNEIPFNIVIAKNNVLEPL
ncbi:Macro domain-containing protein [Entamoeba marina]